MCYDKCEKLFHDLSSISGLNWYGGFLVATSIIIQFEIDFLSFASSPLAVCISLHIRTENQSSANLINPFSCDYY